MGRSRRSALLGLGTVLLGGVLSSAPVEAWDWRNDPFGLRLGLALDRASNFTDVTALSASAAYPFGSSINPANDDFLRAPPYNFTFAFTGTGLYIPFDNRPSITAGAGSITYLLPSAGTFTFAASDAGSHDARSSQGEKFRLDSEDFALGYSHLLGKSFALGGEFKVTKSTLRFESSVDGFPLNTETSGTGYDVRIGALAAPANHWLVGLVVGAGWNDARTAGEVTIPDDFGGSVPVRFRTYTRSINIRGGVAWRPSDSFGAYLDLQYLHLETDEDSTSVGRTFAGVEWLPHPSVALRLGGSLDTAGKGTVSTGVGFYPFKQLQLELAYVYNAFPEVRREFSGAHLISTSVGLIFE